MTDHNATFETKEQQDGFEEEVAASTPYMQALVNRVSIDKIEPLQAILALLGAAAGLAVHNDLAKNKFMGACAYLFDSVMPVPEDKRKLH